jgi:hypothetical protein
MKELIKEAKRFQELAGIINENKVINEDINEYTYMSEKDVIINDVKFPKGQGITQQRFDELTSDQQKHFRKIPDYLKKIINQNKQPYTHSSTPKNDSTPWDYTFDINI